MKDIAEILYLSGYGLLWQDCETIAQLLWDNGYRKGDDAESQYLKWCAEGYGDGLKAPPWISVDTALPPEEGEYLVTNGTTMKVMLFKFPDGFTAFHNKPNFCVWDNSGDGYWVKSTYPTHWTRLPDLPKKEDKQ